MLTTEQEVERKQKVDVARAIQPAQRTAEQNIMIQEADLADATAVAQAATAAANARQWQYERETFLQRNPTFIDNTANVGILKSLLAGKGWGWDAKSMEFCFRNNLNAFNTAAPVVAVASNPALDPPAEVAPVAQNYGVDAEYVRNLKSHELADIRKNQKKKFAVIQQVVNEFSSKYPGLARKYFNGDPLNAQDLADLKA